MYTYFRFGKVFLHSKMEKEAIPLLADGELLKEGLDWDWTGTGLELDWSILANSYRLMQARAYSDEI